MIDAAIRDLVARALDVARGAGASYADARFVTEAWESIDVRGDRLEGVDRSSTAGIGVRVVLDGVWGFAGTSRLDPREVERAARLAVEIAASSRALMRAPVRLAEVEPVVVEWASPFEEDPFDVALGEKIDLLMRCTKTMGEVKGVTYGKGSMQFWRRTSLLATSEGAGIAQHIVKSGAGIESVAVGDDEVQVRSYPNSSRGQYATRGYEAVRAMDMLAHAGRIAEESVALLSAPECPSTQTTLILDGQQLSLQVHESIGHPIELDRVLGMEAAYAGTSFLRPEDRGRLRYGSDQVTVTADATIPGALGTFGYDDEGVPAQRTTVIEAGVFRDFVSSRETAPEIGDARSNGTMRAWGWDVIPLIRMTNINLEPGTSSLDEMISTTKSGIYMSTNQSWSIDDKRVNFQFGCEIAWEIVDGRLGRMLRNPNYAGKTVEFWSSCDAVGGPGEWHVWGTPNCGKGQPGQIGHVGHGTAPGRFRGVQVGVRG